MGVSHKIDAAGIPTDRGGRCLLGYSDRFAGSGVFCVHHIKADSMNRTFLFVAVFVFALLLVNAVSYAGQPNAASKAQTECAPTYGNYAPGERWGWYGARREVKTPLEALEILQKIIVIHHSGIRVGRIREGVRFYMAEIVNTKGQIVDVIVIDRQSGRIRSAY